MGHLTSRRLLKCLVVPLIVAQVGCAARGVQPVSLTPSPSSISEEDRKACGAFAKREAKGVSTGSVADAVGEGLAAGLVGSVVLLNPGVALFAGPAWAIGGAIDQSLKNWRARKLAYASAERTCLEPVILAETLGPEHADVASALWILAAGYANQRDYVAAERLYQRALAIQERALGPESSQVVTTLKAYAELLRSTGRDEQAMDLETRVQAIRTKAEWSRTMEAAAVNATPAETVEPPASASTPPPGNDGGE